jgi:hypothetical protein
VNERAPFSIGAHWRNMDWGFFTGDFERRLRFCYTRRPCLEGIPGRYVKEGCGKVHLSS